LIELGLRLPEEHIQAGGGSRGLHRILFGHRLPAAVVARMDKAEFTGSFVRRMSSVSSDDDSSARTALGDRVDAGGVPAADAWYRWAALSAGLFLSEVLMVKPKMP
jgi:hypothetical protein